MKGIQILQPFILASPMNTFAQAVMFLICIQEVLGSNLSLDTGYSDWLMFFHGSS
jgi:hypothetical protein